MQDRDVVFVVGIGRSGTSALTRVLSLCGCTLPEQLVEDRIANEKGSWESIDSWKLNHEFMFHYGTMSCDPSMRLQEEIQFDQEVKEDYIDKIRTFLAGCPGGSALLIKDPIITEVMEFWFEAARRAGLSVKVVIAFRHPQEVFASWRAREPWLTRGPMSLEFINATWLKFNLLAERQSRGLPRVFVEYSRILQDWVTEIARISKSLSLHLVPDEGAIEEFLTSTLHRQRCSGPISETFGCRWISTVYDIFSGAARDEVVNLSALDDIYSMYRANERTFRVAHDEYRERWERFKSFDPRQFQKALETIPLLKAGQDF